MSLRGVLPARDTGTASVGGVTWSFIFAYAGAAVLMVSLVWWAGVWQVLGNSRLLELLISGGLIRLHDNSAGWIEGLPSVREYVRSLQPIDLRLLLISVLLFFGAWTLKGLQVHLLARFCGIPGPVGFHLRAWYYGFGLGRILPFRLGHVATASALVGQGAPPERAAQVVFMTDLLLVFEIIAFAFVALLFFDWATWFSQLFWALVILVGSFLVMRSGRGESLWEPVAQWGRDAWACVVAMAQRPSLMLQLAALSIVAFLLMDVATYLVSMAYSGERVVLHVSTQVLIMALVASNIARLIPITPGGLGQTEWAMATALYVGGMGYPDAASLAIIASGIRDLSAIIPLAVVAFGYGIETNVRRVVDAFRGVQPVSPAAV